MQLIAFLTEPKSTKPILQRLGLPTQPPPLASARGKPVEEPDIDQTPLFDLTGPEHILEFVFDQTLTG